jgi:hypothetical protein
MVDGQLKSLAAVYTIAFLSVMSLFAIGNILLKYKRSKVPPSLFLRLAQPPCSCPASAWLLRALDRGCARAAWSAGRPRWQHRL